VVNASNRLKLLEWFEHTAGYAALQLTDLTTHTAMLAVQGPRSAEIMQNFGLHAAAELKYYRCALGSCPTGAPAMISRTGYTGEDGFELTIPADEAVSVWEKLLSTGQPLGLITAGLGCRDTLRLEAGMPLYGHELSEQIDPLSVGLNTAVHFDKPEFSGKAALEKIRTDGPQTRRTGLLLEGRRIARENSPVLTAGQTIGHVTSGTFSPTLQQVIAMALVPCELDTPGVTVEVDIRGSLVTAKTTTLPFYRRSA
ncbi:MAG: glycine cleavage T C-terminal barrel domain-containing protein, partial [Planctomycetaceae bacterium]